MKQADTPHIPRAYSVNKFCAVFGVSRSFVYSRIADGTIDSIRIAGRRLIPADAAEALLVVPNDGGRRGTQND